MMQRLQPYRVEPLAGSAGAEGLLTGYYEPLMDASRLPGPGYTVPLYRPPAGLASAGPGTRASKSTPCPKPRRRCAAARSRTWPTRSMR